MWIKKQLLPCLLLCALLAGSPLALAAPEADATGTPEASQLPGPASDELMRMQLRLSELSYRLVPVSGVSDAAHAESLAAFCAQNGLPDDADEETVTALLFSAQAKPAPFATDTVSLGRSVTDTLFATGLALDWSEVKLRLTPNEIYPLTSCTSGIVFRMRYLEGDGHAELSPELSWDDATLFSLLDADGGSRKMPVVVSIGALRIAASIQLNTAVPAQADGMHRYCLYFSGSTSEFGGLADAEHAYLIRCATADDDGALAADGETDLPDLTPQPDPGADASDVSGGEPDGDVLPTDDSD